MDDQGGLFGRPILWRDTMKSPRLFIFDARLIGFFALLVFHLRLWTFALLAIGMLGLWLIEHAGYRFPSALRALRARLVGPARPARARHLYRAGIDYGFEGHPLLKARFAGRARTGAPALGRKPKPTTSPPPHSLPAE